VAFTRTFWSSCEIATAASDNAAGLSLANNNDAAESFINSLRSNSIDLPFAFVPPVYNPVLISGIGSFALGPQ
jgi:hypothetical protein